MHERPRVCIDRRPCPSALRHDVRLRRDTPWHARPDGDRGAALTSSLWTPGQTITVAFLRRRGRPADEAATIERRVRSIAGEWTRHANLSFAWGPGPAAIRISFEDGDSWSLIGTQCLEVPPEEATMNFGWLLADLDERAFRSVVLHEFGHALGMIHEHQNPTAGIRWKHDVVYAHYDAPPNKWLPVDVDRNLFATYDASITQFTACDRRSIMMYPIPAEHLEEGEPVAWNTELSDQDRAFVATLYPRAPGTT